MSLRLAPTASNDFIDGGLLGRIDLQIPLALHLHPVQRRIRAHVGPCTRRRKVAYTARQVWSGVNVGHSAIPARQTIANLDAIRECGVHAWNLVRRKEPPIFRAAVRTLLFRDPVGALASRILGGLGTV